jgi:hypothetical protein
MRVENERSEVEHLYVRLVEALRSRRPDPWNSPVTVAEIYQELVPYRSVRGDAGFAMNADYEHALLRLLSGEGDWARLEPPSAREVVVRELSSPNPNVTMYREYAGCDVWVRQPEPDELATWAPEAAEAEDSVELELLASEIEDEPVADEDGWFAFDDATASRPPGAGAAAHDPDGVQQQDEPGRAAEPAGSGADAGPRAADSGAQDDFEAAPRPGADALPWESGAAPRESGAAPRESGAAPRESGAAPRESGAAPLESGAPRATGGGRQEAPGAPPTRAGMDAPAASTRADTAGDGGDAAAPRSRAEAGGTAATGVTAGTRCVFCDTELPSGRAVRFCPFCGGDQSMRPCGACGEPLEAGWLYCIACGAGDAS